MSDRSKFNANYEAGIITRKCGKLRTKTLDLKQRTFSNSKNIIFIVFKAVTPDIRLGGLAEGSKELLLREKINENQVCRLAWAIF